MSPSRSKSKDKKAAGKEPPKSSTKPSTSANAASGYNPLLGTFHTFETTPVSTVPSVHVNGRFRDIDDSDDPSGNSVGIGIEYDCVSNNGSWSGESEDPKDKPSQGPTSHKEAGPGVDSDKREKNRQKNEKKHQRQKERRAQELHERCCGYLMSRELEALAQQLVAMGFPSERATMALIMNEGKLEESVAWLFEGGEDSGNQRERNVDNGSNLKVDISQELAQIADMEVKFKCSKQEVERAVVACGGDLEQAAENLIKLQNQESNAVPPNPEETSDPPTVGGSVKPSKVQSSRPSSSGSMPIPHKAEERDAIYPKIAVTAGRSLAESGGKNIQLLKKVHPTPSVEKRWAVGGLSPSGSYSLASPLQAAPPPPSKTETQYPSVGNELKNLQLGSIREPVIMMQRPQPKQIPTTSSSASHVVNWSSNGVVDTGMSMGMNQNGFSHMPTTTRNFNNPSYGSNQMYDQFRYQHRQQPTLPQQHYSQLDHRSSQPMASNHLNNNNNGMWNKMVGGTTPTLAAATSLGLFSGNGAPGPSHVDWNGDWSSQFDYTNIDWSLNRLPSPGSSTLRPNGLWMGAGSSPGKSAVRPVSGIVANGNSGVSIGGIGLNRDGVRVGGSETSGGGSREWSSPFEEKDLFSLPRQFVSSPSL